MCEFYSFTQWKNRVWTMTFGFGFCSVLYKVGFRCGSGPCKIFLHLGSGWVRFLLGSVFPISSRDCQCSMISVVHSLPVLSALKNDSFGIMFRTQKGTSAVLVFRFQRFALRLVISHSHKSNRDGPQTESQSNGAHWSSAVIISNHRNAIRSRFKSSSYLDLPITAVRLLCE